MINNKQIISQWSMETNYIGRQIAKKTQFSVRLDKDIELNSFDLRIIHPSPSVYEYLQEHHLGKR